MFLFVAFLIFTGALGAAGYYAWSIPQQHSEEILAGRLRELRMAGVSRTRVGDLVRHERRGAFAPLGDFVNWVGLLRRLQLSIDQANLKYRAADVFAVCLLIAVVSYFTMQLAGLSLLILRIGLTLGLAA